MATTVPRTLRRSGLRSGGEMRTVQSGGDAKKEEEKKVEEKSGSGGGDKKDAAGDKDRAGAAGAKNKKIRLHFDEEGDDAVNEKLEESRKRRAALMAKHGRG